MTTKWWLQLEQYLRRYLARRSEQGQGLVEYALILASVAIFVVIALKFLQPHISNTLNSVVNGL